MLFDVWFGHHSRSPPSLGPQSLQSKVASTFDPHGLEHHGLPSMKIKLTQIEMKIHTILYIKNKFKLDRIPLLIGLETTGSTTNTQIRMPILTMRSEDSSSATWDGCVVAKTKR